MRSGRHRPAPPEALADHPLVDRDEAAGEQPPRPHPRFCRFGRSDSVEQAPRILRPAAIHPFRGRGRGLRAPDAQHRTRGSRPRRVHHRIAIRPGRWVELPPAGPAVLCRRAERRARLRSQRTRNRWCMSFHEDSLTPASDSFPLGFRGPARPAATGARGWRSQTSSCASPRRSSGTGCASRHSSTPAYSGMAATPLRCGSRRVRESASHHRWGRSGSMSDTMPTGSPRGRYTTSPEGALVRIVDRYSRESDGGTGHSTSRWGKRSDAVDQADHGRPARTPHGGRRHDPGRSPR